MRRISWLDEEFMLLKDSFLFVCSRSTGKCYTIQKFSIMWFVHSFVIPKCSQTLYSQRQSVFLLKPGEKFADLLNLISHNFCISYSLSLYKDETFLFYIRPHCLPRSKHFPPRLCQTSPLMHEANVAVCSEIHTKHRTQYERHVEFFIIKTDNK